MDSLLPTLAGLHDAPAQTVLCTVYSTGLTLYIQCGFMIVLQPASAAPSSGAPREVSPEDMQERSSPVNDQVGYLRLGHAPAHLQAQPSAAVIQ